VQNALINLDFKKAFACYPYRTYNQLFNFFFFNKNWIIITKNKQGLVYFYLFKIFFFIIKHFYIIYFLNYIIIKKKIPYVYFRYYLESCHPNKTNNLKMFY